MKIVINLLLLATLAALCGCWLTGSTIDVTRQAAQFGNLTKGRKYQFKRDALTAGRVIAAKPAPPSSLSPPPGRDATGFKKNRSQSSAYSIFPSGSVVEIASIHIIDNITWVDVSVRVKVLTGPFSGKTLFLDYDLLSGSIAGRDFRVNRDWLTPRQ